MPTNIIQFPTFGNVVFAIDGDTNIVYSRDMLNITQYSWNNADPNQNSVMVDVDIRQCRENEVLEIILPPGCTFVNDMTGDTCERNPYIEFEYPLPACFDPNPNISRHFCWAIYDESMALYDELMYGHNGTGASLRLTQGFLDACMGEELGGHFTMIFWEELYDDEDPVTCYSFPETPC